MSLDLPTLMVMQSFAIASAGVILLIARLQNRTASVLALWGIAHLLAACGIIFLMLGAESHELLWSAIGGCLLSSQSSLIWKAARNFDSKPAPLWLALTGPAIVILGGGLPILREASGSLALFMGAVYAIGSASTLWLGRKEALLARWPLIILAGVHGASLLFGTFSTFIGATHQNSVPKLDSLFGFIYFESIVFAVGTCVSIIALFKERNEALSIKAARTDSLTGIANRATFMANAERVLERCRRDGAPVSVMMFDLDWFKSVNDRYGHAVGDAVIRHFCEAASAVLRPTDVFGRIGGEEFAVVLAGSSVEAACARADRIRSSFAESCRFIGGKQINATVSGGVAVSLSGEHALDALLELSDVALYRAKAGGRNRIKRAEQPEPKGEISNVFRVA
jgi:diguanylate cyclase (GGDEF)-like protein